MSHTKVLRFILLQEFNKEYVCKYFYGLLSVDWLKNGRFIYLNENPQNNEVKGSKYTIGTFQEEVIIV